MPTIAFHTLGCKVNQYDTQAMLELFRNAGYQVVPFTDPADIYLINTCTVTGTGDRKSLQLARRIRREHPDARLILCGCMAQHQSDRLMEVGADLVLGTQRRHEVVSLLEQVCREGKPLCAVQPLLRETPFENLSISTQLEHTRATLKIQEGCNNHCAYCIIPSVRGPIRSRPLSDISEEANRLAAAGYRELVLTGIHLSSYGRDFPGSVTLLDAIRAASVQGILRLRLGSLEPTIITEDFAASLRDIRAVCPQFHLALQAGSDAVLRRMRRRYSTDRYREAARLLRQAFPDAALTTDVLTGFPGETEAEFQETVSFLQEIGFARIHVFPYSSRPGTEAAVMPGQISRAVREERARQLIHLGEIMAGDYQASWIGRLTEILPEEQIDGAWEGYSPEYIRVRLPQNAVCEGGVPLRVYLTASLPGKLACVPAEP